MKTFRILILFTTLLVLLNVYTNAKQDDDSGFITILLTKKKFIHSRTLDDYIKINTLKNKKFSRLEKRQSSNITLKDETLADKDMGYIGPITIGNQNFVVLYDTGSLDLWIPDISCASECGNHNRFDPSKSSTFQIIKENFTLSYGLTGDSQSVVGYKGQDTVIFGGVSITQQTFGLVTHEPYGDLEEDGVIGLGPLNVAGFKVNGVMQSVQAQKKLSQNIIGFHLAREKNNSNDISFMTLGGVDQNAVVGSIGYNTANVSVGYWLIPLNDIMVDGSSIGPFQPAPAIIDTVVSLIHTKIPGARLYRQQNEELWIVPCDTKSVISFTFDSGTYSIDPIEFVISVNQSNRSPICVSGIQPNTANYWLLGDVFLSSVYSVFDFDNYRVGFSQTKIILNSNSVTLIHQIALDYHMMCAQKAFQTVDNAQRHHRSGGYHLVKGNGNSTNVEDWCKH
ncbi:16930_t:CDS:2 [Cetraspora pellucida]|uniref:16930_t:CDS:1 n=1 Tax=Cetraspora pellucida TaxID=1433469 RepID=A0A9N9NPK1_9GLOM|nr:16930_t:CDS:2 [Cetraspora pellucida]